MISSNIFSFSFNVKTLGKKSAPNLSPDAHLPRSKAFERGLHWRLGAIEPADHSLCSKLKCRGYRTMVRLRRLVQSERPSRTYLVKGPPPTRVNSTRLPFILVTPPVEPEPASRRKPSTRKSNPKLLRAPTVNGRGRVVKSPVPPAKLPPTRSLPKIPNVASTSDAAYYGEVHNEWFGSWESLPESPNVAGDSGCAPSSTVLGSVEEFRADFESDGPTKNRSGGDGEHVFGDARDLWAAEFLLLQ